MTKQEQSEKIIYGSLITSTKCYNCIHFPLCFAQKSGVNLGLASENDCCYYQSKLSEDSVVLSREEYEKGIIERESMRNQITELFNDREQASKETAEKIYTKIKDSFLMNSNNRYALKLWIEEQFGLEIKE